MAKAWCVEVNGRLWPTWIHSNKKMCREEARYGLCDGFKIVPVRVTKIKSKRRAKKNGD